MAFSRKRMVLSLGILSIAAVLIYLASSLDRTPYIKIGSASGIRLVTEDEHALEIAKALDGLSAAGYSDGHGNRMKGGDSLRAKVRERQQTRLALYSGGVLLLIVGLFMGVRARLHEPIITFRDH